MLLSFRSFRVRRRLTVLLVGCGALLGAGRAADAQVVYDNGLPISGTSRASNTLVPQYLCDTFRFQAPTMFNTITWYGFYNQNSPLPVDGFTLTLYTTTGDVPDQFPFATFSDASQITRTFTGQRLYQTSDLYQYTATLPTSLTLNTGVYGLSIINTVSWLWPTSSNTGTYYVRDYTSQLWGDGDVDGELAFRLSNVAATAPEPSALGLLASPLPLASLLIRRRKAHR